MTLEHVTMLSHELQAQLKRAAADAKMVQSACNFSGVANSFNEIIRETLWPVARMAQLGSGWIGQNPISRLFTYKLNSLAGAECLCDTCWRGYREACGELTALEITLDGCLRDESCPTKREVANV